MPSCLVHPDGLLGVRKRAPFAAYLNACALMYAFGVYLVTRRATGTAGIPATLKHTIVLRTRRTRGLIREESGKLETSSFRSASSPRTKMISDDVHTSHCCHARRDVGSVCDPARLARGGVDVRTGSAAHWSDDLSGDAGRPNHTGAHLHQHVGRSILAETVPPASRDRAGRGPKLGDWGVRRHDATVFEAGEHE